VAIIVGKRGAGKGADDARTLRSGDAAGERGKKGGTGNLCRIPFVGRLIYNLGEIFKH